MTLLELKQLLNITLLTMGGSTITVASVGLFIFVVIVTLLIARVNVRFFSRLRVTADASSASSLYVLQRLFNYLLLGLGSLIALTTLGLDFTHLALLATALSVGIGFGLQSIFNNFFSGIIILFERSVKVGDYIELDNGLGGTVMEINIRSTQILTRDNLDILVPNSEFVNGRVTNWTLTDPTRRVTVPFGVAYGSDKDKVRAAAIEAASAVSFTLYGKDKRGRDRDPDVRLVNFGESSLDFQLVVWVDPRLNPRPGALTATYLWELDTSLKKAGITIPFPQRDLHIIKDESLNA